MEIPILRKSDEPFDSVVLLFPTDDAKSLTEMKSEELEAIKRVIIIDCTWNQTKHFLRQPNVMSLKKVKI